MNLGIVLPNIGLIKILYAKFSILLNSNKNLFVLDSSKANLIKKNNSKKWFLDLRLEAKRRMQKFGITVFIDNYCTFGEKELFFSFRRNQSPRRMVTVVWRKNG